MFNYYKIGGSLKYRHPTYVKRKADQELWDNLQKKNYCFVLNSRQMGKSSLKVKTARELKTINFNCASIDLTLLGTNVTAEQWYQGLIYEILNSLEIELEIYKNNLCFNYEQLTPLQKFKNFLDWLLQRNSHPLVIFIDEIDSLINIPFKDEFLSFLRACYNYRSENPDYNRLIFCLLGVASPADLITDKDQTPFNIGYSLELSGLTFAEAKSALIPGLESIVNHPEQILQQVLDWTGGQPFLTQKLCSLVVEYGHPHLEDISPIVQQYIIEDWENQDQPEHLRTIRDRLLYHQHKAISLLGLYQQILDPNTPVKASGQEAETALRLSGLIVKQGNYLQVYNRIYARIFNQEWIAQQIAELRPYDQWLQKWLQSAQDSTYLLQDKALAEAQQWAMGKNLTDLDYRYLNKSQHHQDQQKNQILSQAYQKARLILTITVIFALILVLGAMGYAKRLQTITNLEKKGKEALEQFNTQQLKGLTQAIATTQELQKQTWGNPSLSEYPTLTPIATLIEILSQIQEYHQWTAHKTTIKTVSFNPDGSRLVSGSDDGVIKIWDKQGKLHKSFSHQGVIYNLKYTLDGEKIISASDSGTLKIWTKEGDLIQTLASEKNTPIYSFGISPDSQLIASGGKYGTIKIWDIQGNLQQTIATHQTSIYSIDFSPDSQTFASAGADGIIRLWSRDGTLIKEIVAHDSDVNSVIFSPDGNLIVSASGDRTIKIWTREGELIQILRDHQDSIWSLQFSPDSSTLVSSSFDQTVKVWQYSDFNQQWRLLHTLYGHRDQVYGISFSADGHSLVSSSSDRTLKLWRLFSSPLVSITGHQDWITEVSIDAEGEKIVSGSYDGGVKLWDSRGKKRKFLTQEDDIIIKVKFSPDNNQIITISSKGIIQVWDSQGNLIHSWLTQGGYINSLSISKDGQTLMTGDELGQIKLWNKEGNILAKFPRQSAPITSIDMDSQSRTFISSTNTEITLWNQKQIPLKIWRTEQLEINTIGITSNGKLIASAGKDGTIKLWNREGQLLDTLGRDNTPVNDLEFSSDGKLLITGHQDGFVRLWRVRDRALLFELQAYQGENIESISLSANDQVLVANTTQAINLWQLNLNKLLALGSDWLKEHLN